MRPDFSLIWGADNAPFTPIEASDYTAGWVFRTGAPPRRVNFDYFQNLSDQRTAWLGEQMLLAVGHEWQNDVTYDAYAITRSPVNGQLYRSLAGGNLNNEPSVSGAQWALGIGADIPDSILTSGIAGVASSLKASATGTNATVTVTADAICLKNASNEQVVINALALAINSAAVGVNGLDTGVIAASTWYSIWAIWNETTGTTAGLLSLSATAPTMPAGYTHKARAGWIRTDGTANKFPLSFIQAGRKVQYKVSSGSNVTRLPSVVSGVQGSIVTPTWVAVSLSNTVPPTAVSVNAVAHSVTANSGVIVAPNNSYGFLGSSTNPPYMTVSSGSTADDNQSNAEIILESTALYFASNDALGYLLISSWEDSI